ncbi:hypothetical protein ACIGCP_04230 [Cellulophaga baltica]|uniref:hypothetical protein n=1 Tax=Cellulophaga TaxID=104264 RepID=UPI00051CF954|nr:hypothetical protein [Cellulophaga sp. E6(2014)]KGK32212.1 hypothetical protein EL45_02745 [Cellulophaga sp. E6(2014)]
MNELEKSIEKTIESSDLQNLSMDLTEVVIDSVLEDGLLKDIPIVGTIVGLSKFGMKLQERILLSKVFNLLQQLGHTTIEERQAFLKKVESSETYNKKVGAALILILDKLSDLEKPTIIGKLFAAAIKNEIDYQTFLRISNIIENIFLPDLDYAKKLKQGQEIDIQIKEELFRVGLMKRTMFGQIQTDGSNEYYLNDLAHKLINILEN